MCKQDRSYFLKKGGDGITETKVGQSSGLMGMLLGHKGQNLEVICECGIAIAWLGLRKIKQGNCQGN